MRRLLPLALTALAHAGLASAASAAVTLEPVGRFDQPIAVAGAPGDEQHLYVVEKPGRIKVVQGGVASEFLDLADVVEDGGEQGLLDLAFAPDFQTSRRFYVYFTDLNGDDRVEELRAPTGDRADPASRRLVMRVPHPVATNHNGGTLTFGPDGMLWLAPGDGGTASNARNLDNLLGKVLRIDPAGDAPGEHRIPLDNPFAGLPGHAGEIWAFGLRNPFRFAFDRLTGDLLLGDVGQDTTEEINWLPAASGRGRGADLGWSVCEGSFDQGSRTTPCSLRDAVLPVLYRYQDDGYRSIITGPVVRDASLPSLYGRLVYGDFFVRGLRTALLGGPSATDDRAIGADAEVPNLTSLGEDAAGCVYATSQAGPVYRLVEQDRRIPCLLPPAPPSAPAPPSTPPAARPADTTPELLLSGRRRQRVLLNGGPVVRARCKRPCRVAAGGSLRVGATTFPLGRVEGAGERVRLKPTLGRRGRRALRAALDDGRHPLLAVRVRARDADGDRSPLLQRAVRAIG